ncbi:MAG: magnesium-protoporphyrin IX monomethyl ester (oxidative) cyclase, partial [Halieaceae bacterium]
VPLTLHTRSPKFQKGLERLLDLNMRLESLEGQRGLSASLSRLGLQGGTALTILRLFLLPADRNEMPKQVAMQPAW